MCDSATSLTGVKILEGLHFFQLTSSNHPKLHKACGVFSQKSIRHKPCGESWVPDLSTQHRTVSFFYPFQLKAVLGKFGGHKK